MPSCIYCRRENQEFDREHVIPQAFGNFEPNSFILYDAVCKECNTFFGRTLDFALSRDSMEALLRFRYGTKPASQAGDLPYHKLELKIGQPGPWFGATVVLEPDATGQAVEPVPVPQAAFRWKGSQDWTFFVEHELKADVLAKYAKPIPGTLEIRVMGPTTADHERVLEILKSAGINFRQEGSLMSPITDDGKVLVEIAAAVDQTIFRAIAKIAFNYVAHQHGSNFVLRSDFDDVRNYIRYGTAPSWTARTPVVLPFHKPILYDDKPLSRQTNGHLITFDWNNGRTGFLSQVSLFNTITYHVGICPEFKGLWRDDYYRGHHFNTEERTIAPLTRVSKPLLQSLR
jgi:HNH endonuclease